MEEVLVGSGSILIVEGNQHLRSLLAWHLQQAGYWTFQSPDIRQGREAFYNRVPALVILESELPDGDGIEFCRWMHERQKPMILILSARINESDIVAGLKAGADDYLRKPFGIQEFLARVEALMRRHKQTTPAASLDYGPLQIDLIQRCVRNEGQQIDLTPQEFSLLYVLAQADGLPMTRAELLRRAWPDAIDNPRTIDTHVLSLRKKLETDPRQPNLIQTVRNVGYRFNVEKIKTNPVVENGASKEKVDKASPVRHFSQVGAGDRSL